MSGGLIQLVAYGVQDMYLTKDPQITFFKIVYRRHTNFSTEVIPQFFTHGPDFGRRVTAIINRNGDLIGKTHLVVILPTIPQFKDENNDVDILTKFAWVRRVGYALIKTIEIEIGNELIDRQYGDWLNIWHELTITNNKDLSKILGDVKELTEFSNGKKQYKLFIPLKFWFNRFYGLALPAISLQYNHIKINLEINDFDKLHIITPTHYIEVDNDFVNFEKYEFIEQIIDGVRSLARFIHFDIINRRLYIWRLTNNGFLSVSVDNTQNIQTEADQDAVLYARNPDGSYVNQQYFIRGLTTDFLAMPKINVSERSHTNRSIAFENIIIKDAFLLVEFIYLDNEERVRFSQARHEYLIEQVFFNGENTINGINQSFKLGFTQPCKELQWVTQLTLTQNTRINDLFNYTNSLIKDKNENPIGKNIILKETVLFNSQERVSLRDSDYFELVQPYQNHTHNPQTGINTYSFALHPEKHQPSATANMSKIDNTLLKLIVNPEIDFQNTAKLRIYCIVYNVLRISNGLSGLVFANDREESI